MQRQLFQMEIVQAQYDLHKRKYSSWGWLSPLPSCSRGVRFIYFFATKVAGGHVDHIAFCLGLTLAAPGSWRSCELRRGGLKEPPSPNSRPSATFDLKFCTEVLYVRMIKNGKKNFQNGGNFFDDVIKYVNFFLNSAKKEKIFKLLSRELYKRFFFLVFWFGQAKSHSLRCA